MDFIKDLLVPTNVPLWYVFVLYAIGVLPSFVWLGYYLSKDAHPEPKGMIIRVFLIGMLVTLPVLAIESLIKDSKMFGEFPFSAYMYWFLYFLIGVAFVEELFKFFAAKFGAFANKNLDEPVDVMIYMIVAALGFAAAENILRILDFSSQAFADILWINVLRFLDPIFLHAIASGLFGYFIALSRYQKRNHMLYWLLGLAIATVLHTAFNFYIYTVGGSEFGNDSYLLYSTIILIGLAFFVSLAFRKLRRMKNVL